MKWEYGVLTKGDHIRVNRNHYYHHGIYLGNNEVIHYTGEKSDDVSHPENVKVRITNLDFFANGNPIEKAVYSFREKLNRNPVEKIIEIAKSRLGEANYNFVKNNCEDFANQCCYKKMPKTQIDSFREKVAKVFKK